MNRWRTRTTRNAAVGLSAALLLLSACSGGNEAADEPTPSTSVSPSPSSTVTVPEGVDLTDVGARLDFGDSANVIFEPNQNKGTVLELTVKGAAQGKLKDFSGFILDEYTKKSTPYYVKVKVANVGEGDVGGAGIPLWGVDAKNTLLPAATFTTSFKACPSQTLPKKFPAKASFSTCLVFLAPDKGTLKAVSFRPNQEFDPIEWTGDITTPAPEKKATEKKAAKKKQGGKG